MNRPTIQDVKSSRSLAAAYRKTLAYFQWVHLPSTKHVWTDADTVLEMVHNAIAINKTSPPMFRNTLAECVETGLRLAEIKNN